MSLEFEVEYETPIPVYIHSDAMRVRQVLLNLLSNAIKFTRKGQVRLVARCVDPGTEASRVELVVSDTGIGLSAKDIENLFQPFQQASASTTRNTVVLALVWPSPGLWPRRWVARSG